MLGFCERVLDYSRGTDRDAFFSDTMRCDASLRNLELLGEAATHVPDDWRAKAPAVPWRQIVATRNRLIHAYLGIDADTVWSIISVDVPQLSQQLQALLDQP